MGLLNTLAIILKKIGLFWFTKRKISHEPDAKADVFFRTICENTISLSLIGTFKPFSKKTIVNNQLEHATAQKREVIKAERWDSRELLVSWIRAVRTGPSKPAAL